VSPLLSRWGAPATYVAAVLVIGLTLITVLTRSPATKLNVLETAEGYSRTELALIDQEDVYEGLGAEWGSDPASVFIRAGCAGCHGLSGEGSAVGPDIWQKNAEDLAEALREGSEGMPRYRVDEISDELAEAISEYLNGLREASPNAAPDAAASSAE
jgi:mono/diheme cytochrome c family protein